MNKIIPAMLLGLLAASAAQASEELAKAKNCMGCHAMDKKLIGPAYKEVAKKYAGKKGAEDEIVTALRQGAKGEWGPVAMPPNPGLSEADARTLAKWVLSLK